MLYGTSKTITEYISRGESFANVKKVYSINILYFGLGQGKDYVYHGRTEFRGIHTNDVLKLSEHQQQQFMCQNVGELFPEYYVLRVDEFDKKAVTPLDEWISFLKTGDIPRNAKARGLTEARETLLFDRLSKKEQQAYDAHMEAVRYQRSVIQTGLIEGRLEGLLEGRAKGREEGREEGRAEGIIEGRTEGKREQALLTARNALSIGMSKEDILKLTGLNEKDLADLEF
jgi:hypothetical protein